MSSSFLNVTELVSLVIGQPVSSDSQEEREGCSSSTLMSTSVSNRLLMTIALCLRLHIIASCMNEGRTQHAEMSKIPSVREKSFFSIACDCSLSLLVTKESQSTFDYARPKRYQAEFIASTYKKRC